jgi:hypothetical protein
MNIHERILAVQGLLGRSMKAAPSAEEQELFRVAAAALMFISESGAVHPFEDYLASRRDAPPYAVASFETREAADAWLRQHPEPPHGAFVLISDAYFIVMHVREQNRRDLLPHPILEGTLQRLQRDAPAAPGAAFASREEAVAWLKAQPKPPPRAYLQIAGTPHAALYHPNLRHHALYPLPVPGAP